MDINVWYGFNSNYIWWILYDFHVGKYSVRPMDPMFHQNSTSLQGLDFWVEPQGGHIADEDQDPFFPSNTKTKGGGSGKREILKKKQWETRHTWQIFNFISLKLISKSEKRKIVFFVCYVFVSCLFVQWWVFRCGFNSDFYFANRCGTSTGSKAHHSPKR